MLVVANFGGGAIGSFSTFALNAYPYKGRLVVYATLGYGVACFAFGCSRQLSFGTFMVALMGAADAVGATMRKQVVLLSTPNELRGRAQAGHTMAAYVANSIGQIYVGFMASTIGPGHTMQIGGTVTEVMTLLFAWRIPKLLTYRGSGQHAGRVDGGTSTSTASELERAPGDFEELNDAALAARQAEAEATLAGAHQEHHTHTTPA